MNNRINEILNNPWITIESTYEHIAALKLTIPRQPGLYSISTNASKEILRQFGPRNDRKHYNLMDKINTSELIPNTFTINQNAPNELYCVYNGHHQNLSQRFSEHFLGSRGTGCLALFEIERLRDFNWTFQYLNLGNIENYSDSKIFRTLLEQQLRVNSGWPILCSQ